MENRLDIRVPVEPQCRARVRMIQGTVCEIPVRNLSAGGCCLEWSTDQANGLASATLMEGLELVHPSLPGERLKARVTWVGSGSAGPDAPVPMGLKFVQPPTWFSKEVIRFVRNWEKYEHLNQGFDGMPA